MKTVELFHLPGCPYCVKAGKVIDELVVRNPAYGGIEVKWIDESIETEYADTKDYYYVPTISSGTRSCMKLIHARSMKTSRPVSKPHLTKCSLLQRNMISPRKCLNLQSLT